MKSIVIVGAGGTGEDVAGFLYDINDVGPTYECLGFLDDDPAKQGTCIGGLPVLGPLEQAKEYPDAAFVDCLGSPRTFLQRQERAAELGIDDDRFETIIHPSAVVAHGCSVGNGCVLYPFTHIGPGVELGDRVVILSHSVIHHHSRVGRFTIVASGCNVSGGVVIGESSYLGAGCSIRDGASIGDHCLIGMGSVVVEAVESGSVVAGVPARFIRSSS